MANTDNPNGFTPAYHMTGGTIRMAEMRIADDYATSIYSGDIVKVVAAGVIERSAASDASVGVFAGCSYTKDNGEVVFSQYWPASTSVNGSYATAYVYNDPQIVYRAQFTAASGIAEIGSRADVLATAGSTTNGRSSEEIDSSDLTDALLKVIDFVDSPDNDPASNNAEAYVMIAEHQFAPSALSADV
jgi:hypothetical protein